MCLTKLTTDVTPVFRQLALDVLPALLPKEASPSNPIQRITEPFSLGCLELESGLIHPFIPFYVFFFFLSCKSVPSVRVQVVG